MEPGTFVPLLGEQCLATDETSPATGYYKIGDGVTDFTDLPWITTSWDSIANKPLDIERPGDTIIPEQTFSLELNENLDGTMVMQNWSLTSDIYENVPSIGDNIQVIFNGIIYKATVSDISKIYPGVQGAYIGNPRIYSNSLSEADYPFLFIDMVAGSHQIGLLAEDVENATLEAVSLIPGIRLDPELMESSDWDEEDQNKGTYIKNKPMEEYTGNKRFYLPVYGVVDAGVKIFNKDFIFENLPADEEFTLVYIDENGVQKTRGSYKWFTIPDDGNWEESLIGLQVFAEEWNDTFNDKKILFCSGINYLAQEVNPDTVSYIQPSKWASSSVEIAYLQNTKTQKYIKPIDTKYVFSKVESQLVDTHAPQATWQDITGDLSTLKDLSKGYIYGLKETDNALVYDVYDLTASTTTPVTTITFANELQEAAWATLEDCLLCGFDKENSKLTFLYIKSAYYGENIFINTFPNRFTEGYRKLKISISGIVRNVATDCPIGALVIIPNWDKGAYLLSNYEELNGVIGNDNTNSSTLIGLTESIFFEEGKLPLTFLMDQNIEFEIFDNAIRGNIKLMLAPIQQIPGSSENNSILYNKPIELKITTKLENMSAEEIAADLPEMLEIINLPSNETMSVIAEWSVN